MTTGAPIRMTWDGETMRPAGKWWARLADKEYVIGEELLLVEHHERSHKTHAHYFASVHNVWANLNEEQIERFPTEEALRKYALIRTGFADSQTLVCSSRAEALRFAAFMRPLDEFSVITVTGATVTRYTAKSQSMKAMGKEDFARSKTAVLDFLSDMIGVTTQSLIQQESA